MWLPIFPIYWRIHSFSIVYSWLLCQILLGHICLGLFLNSWFWSISIYICFYVTTILFWLLYLCYIVWNQEKWCLQLWSSSRSLWLFMVFCSSMQILGLCFLILWKLALEYMHFLHNLLRIYIMKGCWILTNAFSASIGMINQSLSFLLLMWYIIFVDLCMLKHSYIARINPTWSWCMNLLMSY